MSQRAVGAWMFGKMPTLGDFVARGLGQQARVDLDTWLSQEMVSARAEAGEGFEARYDAAPAWNFVECDDAGQWNGGALCASQDQAGRRFPLIMDVARPAGPGIELGVRCEQRLAAPGAIVHPRRLVAVICPGKRAFGSRLAQDGVLLGGQLGAPFGVGEVDFVGHGMLLGGEYGEGSDSLQVPCKAISQCV